MKLKLDFVTNSSSTAYVAIIPNNIDLSDFFEIVKGDSDLEYDLEQFDDDKGKYLEAVSEAMQTLTTGRTLWREDCPVGFFTLVEYLENKGFIVGRLDAAGGDGCDIIEALKIPDVKNALKKVEEYETKT